MDLLGANLDEMLQKHTTFDIGTIVNITIQLVTIFRDIHSQGLLYRDVKPENVLIGSEFDKIMLVDFGLAKYFLVKGEGDKGS